MAAKFYFFVCVGFRSARRCRRWYKCIGVNGRRGVGGGCTRARARARVCVCVCVWPDGIGMLSDWQEEMPTSCAPACSMKWNRCDSIMRTFRQ